jgi:hypothetical protein
MGEIDIEDSRAKSPFFSRVRIVSGQQ